ncbi:Acetyl-coenzyme A synthetase [Nucleospora cyclopteri]
MISYFEEYEKSKNTEAYWKNQAENLVWNRKFIHVHNGQFGNDKWFEGGQLNACYNCVDRHCILTPDKDAIIYNDNDGNTVKITYKKLFSEVNIIANILKPEVEKGDCVTIYMGMGPEAIYSILACTRLGIIHNVVFGGYSAASLRLRIDDSNSRFVITSDICNRGMKQMNFMEKVLEATHDMNVSILVFNEKKVNLQKIKNVRYFSQIQKVTNFVECVPVDSEHPLFYLYTSGSTDKPKGLLHTTGGYLTYARSTTKMAFDVKENDVFCCTADIGWITGHTYSIYGPLLLGITTVVLGGLPNYPSYDRLYRIVEEYGITQLYTAPTTIRILKKFFETEADIENVAIEDKNKFTSKFDLSSLRILGSVGEPINKTAYNWFSKSFGNLPIVDCYWQTETGGIVIASVCFGRKQKPECAGMPMPGIFPMIGGKNEINKLGKIYITKSWPGIARTIIGNKSRYESSYFSMGIYYTGDEGYIDDDEDIWIRGRADDVINVCGHRISTAEVESVACTNTFVAEAAAVGIPHVIKGFCIYLLIVTKDTNESNNKKIEKSVFTTINDAIGGIARPERIVIVEGLPKTATGKIMRRILRHIINEDILGDVSTCVNSEVIECIKSRLS